jgi:SAM-dependent methyltransferase
MADMFANTRAYEARMERWSARLAPLFVHFAQITDGGHVLDVGCGTGVLVRTVSAMTRQSEIVGIDPAQPFIEYARTQLADPRLIFDRGTALDLPYPAGTFDYTLSLLVLMFLPHPEQAASEMHRVTHPGGTVAACTWDREGLEMTAIFWEDAIRLDPAAAERAERLCVSTKPGSSPPCGTRQGCSTSKRRPSRWAWSSPPLTIIGNRISQATVRRASTSRDYHRSTVTRYTLVGFLWRPVTSNIRLQIA